MTLTKYELPVTSLANNCSYKLSKLKKNFTYIIIAITNPINNILLTLFFINNNFNPKYIPNTIKVDLVLVLKIAANNITNCIIVNTLFFIIFSLFTKYTIPNK